MRFGLMFSCQAPPTLGVPWSEPYRDMLACLPRAEELGFASAHMASHHVQPDGFCPSPLLALAAAASVTERMRLATGVLLVPLYAPLKLAEDVAVLDNISNGRLIFGVAPGYVSEEFAAHGVPRDEKRARFEEALDLLTLAWTEETFSFAGRFFQVPECSVTPKPVQSPHPPIWYGVSGKKSLEAAARRGATLIASPRHGIAELREHYATYDAALAAAGHAPSERPVMREVFVAETKQKAEEIAGPAVTYLFRELYGKASAAGDRVLRDDKGNPVTDMESVDFEHFKSRYVIGDPDFAIRELKRYEDELGATEIIAWMHFPGIRGEDAMRSVELFSRHVIPAFGARVQPGTV